jgi:hypothetical protein
MLSYSSDPLAVTASVRFYEMLVAAYPPGFRRTYGAQMVQVFRDTCRDRVNQSGALGLLALWLRTLSDAARSILIEHFSEWRQTMKNTTTWTRVSYLLLLVPFVFVVVNVSIYVLGIGGVFDGLRTLFDRVQDAGFGLMLDILLVFGPPVAFGLNVLALLDITLRPDDGSLLNIRVRKGTTGQYVVIAVGVLVMAILGTYLLFENGPCFFGGQANC